MLTAGIKKFFSKFNNYLFTYKDGYFELPYLGNSPYTLIETMSKMPFIRHNKLKKILTVNNLFCVGNLHYQEIEKGFFLNYTSIVYKKNVTFNIQYDKSLNADYYVISFVQSLKKIKSVDTRFNGFEYKNSSWSIAKPNALQRSYHDKDSEYLYVSFYVSSQWVETNLNHATFKKFKESNQNFLFFADLMQNVNDAYLSISTILNNRNEEGDLDYLLLKSESYKFINTFFKKLQLYYETKSPDTIKDEEIKKITKAEKVLIEHLFDKFPGIEATAAEIGMSPTKLKVSFKQYYGQTMFDYYNTKQLNYAKQLLEEQSKNIKEIANLLGYANASKFSSAFKKHFGMLPSAFTKEE